MTCKDKIRSNCQNNYAAMVAGPPSAVCIGCRFHAALHVGVPTPKPEGPKIFEEVVVQEILQERVSSSRDRINPRGVKRKISNYKLRPRERRRTTRINFSGCVRIVK